jgi:lipid-A-disaccharide synthase
MARSIFISAGEASGEHYGARLLAELKHQLAGRGEEARFIGMGGERMEAAGLERIVRAEDVAVMGLTEVVRHLPRIYGEFQKLKRAIRAERPAVAVLIDFPEIHLRLARLFHELGIPVVYFVSPQIWAWKKHRIKLIQQYVRRMAVIFPFEEPFYREHGVEAEFVGHPLAELPPPAIMREEFARAHGLNAAARWIGLLPGSRPHEIRDHLPEMIAAARSLDARVGPSEYLVPLAATLNAEQRAKVRATVAALGAGLKLHLVEDARAALAHARASVVASGTATVEAALIGNPFVVVYHVSPVTFAIAKRVVQVKNVAMANLIAGRVIVPELLQNEFRAEVIVRHLVPLLEEGEPRVRMIAELQRVGRILREGQRGAGAIVRVAAMTLEEMDGRGR